MNGTVTAMNLGEVAAPSLFGATMSMIALLEGKSPTGLKQHAVDKLLEMVDWCWPQIAEAVPLVEQAAKELPEPSRCHLLLAKTFFHLGDYERAVGEALMAGPAFDVSTSNAFTDAMLAKMVALYATSRQKGDDEVSMGLKRLEQMVEAMIRYCSRKGDLHSGIGLAIEARRLDLVQALVCQGMASSTSTTQTLAILGFARAAANGLGHFGKRVVEMLGDTLLSSTISVAPELLLFAFECFIEQEDIVRCKKLLKAKADEALSSQSMHSWAVLLQVGLLIAADASPKFRQATLAEIKSMLPEALPTLQRQLLEKVYSGTFSRSLCLDMLSHENRADLQILEKTKGSLMAKNSMHQAAMSLAHGLFCAGTTNDDFLRRNLDWLAHASNWSKYTATASLGMIHSGQDSDDLLRVLQPYLPKINSSSSGSPYAEGGALFALGLAHVGLAINETGHELLLSQVQNAADRSANEGDGEANEALLHGACLGLGLTYMASFPSDESIVSLLESLERVLYRDDAVSGEAAAIAIGLVMMGSGGRHGESGPMSELAQTIMQYGNETQHEKISRAIGLSMALMYIGMGDCADTVIDSLLQEPNAVMRFGGAWTVAAAYACSADKGAIDKLLHLAVSDANDDVRRAAAVGLGFVLDQRPEELLKVIELLLASYNPHVRYGAAMALGVGLAGTASSRAIDLLRPLCRDFVDFVRQGAYLALALVLQQQNDASSSEAVSWLHTALDSVVSMKHEDAMAKFGAVLAQGLLDAGGRNTLFSLRSALGNLKSSAVAGAMLFMHFWYWFPMAPFAVLALRPTALIGVTVEGKVPTGPLALCAAPASRFAYPPALKESVSDAPKQLFTAVLSAASRNRSRKQMQVDDMQQQTLQEEQQKKDAKQKSEDEKKILDKEAEETSFVINNMSRLTASQQPLVSFTEQAKWKPVISNWNGGILILLDAKPDQAVEYFGSKTEESVPVPKPFPCPDNLK